MNDLSSGASAANELAKFSDPEWTADGERRAEVPMTGLQTLWFNTGTLCNIECANCYIESSPSNDRLVYLTAAEVDVYLDEITTLDLPVREIAFTGGEPFMNRDMIAMARSALSRGRDVLILTNAMRPMMRPKNQAGLLALVKEFPDQLTIRVSIDHYTAARHDEERGEGAFEKTLTGMRWLSRNGLKITAAGRTMWGESEAEARAGFAELFGREGFVIDCSDPGALVLFPEMDEKAEVPEITTACWGILNKRPEDVMCASSRMVVKRQGADRPTVLACTLIAYDPAFEISETLGGALGAVKLKHPHCSKFCVLGGASCSA